MERLSVVICFSIFLVSSFLRGAETSQAKRNDVYVVYMGSVSPNGAQRKDHSELLSSLVKRNKNAVLHNYKNGISGFAARLSEEEAKVISQRPGVVSVFRDPVLQLHTTHSWDFLNYQTALKIDSAFISPSNSSSPGGADTIIGILDTGIWPESQSFSDNDMGPIPSNWKGACMEGHDFTSSSCNRKLIGARYYDEDIDSEDPTSGTPRDKNGHGTHVASTAAGNTVKGASYYGLAQGTAKGGSPGSRIAMYRVCTTMGCMGSAILKAFDDAIADGVDVLSLSLGSSAGLEPEFTTDPIAIGSFHASEKGIIVVCSAGNDGPGYKTVVNTAPWILTVAATSIDRDFESDIVLGGNKVIKGGGINFSNIKKSPVYPLIYGGSSAEMETQGKLDADSRNCIPGSLDDGTVKGKIVLCENEDTEYSAKQKFAALSNRGAIGLILIDNDSRAVPQTYGALPIAAVTKEDGAQILSYIKSNSNPVATILPTVTTPNYKPAPVVPYFSSRGPSFNKNLLKPDIAAPGVAIVAAWPGNDTKETVSGREPPLYNVLSGTSMACPHVSGVAATVRAQYPTWSPSVVKSAIMTTAIQTNNLQTPITTSSGSKATPYDIGAGEISTSGPLQPGLVYETQVIEHLQFLCSIGYDMSQIKKIATTIPDNFSCPSGNNSDSISSLNYPSIAISLKGNESKKVTRIVTNVGEDESIYTAIIDGPKGLVVEVAPSKLEFTKNIKKLTYQVTFRPTTSITDDMFGSIIWTNGKYKVRSPFVVSSN